MAEIASEAQNGEVQSSHPTSLRQSGGNVEARKTGNSAKNSRNAAIATLPLLSRLLYYEAEMERKAAREMRKNNNFKVQIRPLNCPSDQTESGKRCPDCKQVHLRPGYCQARDPINAAQYPHMHVTLKPESAEKHRAETETLTTVSSENNELEDSETLSDPRDETLSTNETLTGERKCAVCGLAFHPKRETARYCSAACRLQAHRRQA